MSIASAYLATSSSSATGCSCSFYIVKKPCFLFVIFQLPKQTPYFLPSLFLYYTLFCNCRRNLLESGGITDLCYFVMLFCYCLDPYVY